MGPAAPAATTSARRRSDARNAERRGWRSSGDSIHHVQQIVFRSRHHTSRMHLLVFWVASALRSDFGPSFAPFAEGLLGDGRSAGTSTADVRRAARNCPSLFASLAMGLPLDRRWRARSDDHSRYDARAREIFRRLCSLALLHSGGDLVGSHRRDDGSAFEAMDEPKGSR